MARRATAWAYGGGFYDRTLAALQPRPTTVGLGYTQGYLDDFEPGAHDPPLDAILNDNGVVWPAEAHPRAVSPAPLARCAVRKGAIPARRGHGPSCAVSAEPAADAAASISPNRRS